MPIGLDIFQGVKYDEQGNLYLHLQFAGDTILFSKNSTKSVKDVKQVLQCFELLSDLKVNFSKS